MKYFFSISLLLLFSCKTETEVNTNVTSKQLPNNKLLEVLKTEKTATRRGIFTHSDYGSTYSFNYQFTVNKKEVIWKDKGSAVPKTIVFCNDTTYIKYLQKKSVSYQQFPNDTIVKYKDTIVEKYDQFIDKRYFFKWFGKVSWLAISKDEYNAKKLRCSEYVIPNDEDFKNIKNPKKGYVNYEVLKDSIIYHYIFYNGINLYRGESHSFKVKEADPKTFKEFSKKYAKDSLHIFYKGHKLKKRDVNSFRVLDKLITADKHGAYFDNKIMKGSHGPSFRFMEDNYGKDNNQMYYLGLNFYTIFKGVDTKTAKILVCKTCSNRYVTDKKQVYYQGELIKVADVKTFEVLSFEYSKDNKHIFYRDEIIKDADYNSFHILKPSKKIDNLTFKAADKNNEYGCSNHNLELIIQKK